MNEYKEYSELNKLAAINYKRIAIKEFIEWCCAHNIIFYDLTNLDEIIFYYFDIDIKKVEAERQEIIANANGGES